MSRRNNSHTNSFGSSFNDESSQSWHDRHFFLTAQLTARTRPDSSARSTSSRPDSLNNWSAMHFSQSGLFSPAFQSPARGVDRQSPSPAGDVLHNAMQQCMHTFHATGEMTFLRSTAVAKNPSDGGNWRASMHSDLASSSETNFDQQLQRQNEHNDFHGHQGNDEQRALAQAKNTNVEYKDHAYTSTDANDFSDDGHRRFDDGSGGDGHSSSDDEHSARQLGSRWAAHENNADYFNGLREILHTAPPARWQTVPMAGFGDLDVHDPDAWSDAEGPGAQLHTVTPVGWEVDDDRSDEGDVGGVLSHRSPHITEHRSSGIAAVSRYGEANDSLGSWSADHKGRSRRRDRAASGRGQSRQGVDPKGGEHGQEKRSHSIDNVDDDHGRERMNDDGDSVGSMTDDDGVDVEGGLATAARRSVETRAPGEVTKAASKGSTIVYDNDDNDDDDVDDDVDAAAATTDNEVVGQALESQPHDQSLDEDVTFDLGHGVDIHDMSIEIDPLNDMHCSTEDIIVGACAMIPRSPTPSHKRSSADGTDRGNGNHTCNLLVTIDRAGLCKRLMSMSELRWSAFDPFTIHCCFVAVIFGRHRDDDIIFEQYQCVTGSTADVAIPAVAQCLSSDWVSDPLSPMSVESTVHAGPSDNVDSDGGDGGDSDGDGGRVTATIAPHSSGVKSRPIGWLLATYGTGIDVPPSFLDAVADIMRKRDHVDSTHNSRDAGGDIYAEQLCLVVDLCRSKVPQPMEPKGDGQTDTPIPCMDVYVLQPERVLDIPTHTEGLELDARRKEARRLRVTAHAVDWTVS